MKKYNYTTKTLNLNRDNEEDLRILEYLNTKRKVSDYLRELVLNDMKKENYKIILDLKPALDEEKLDARILRDFKELKNKQFKNSLDKLLPKKMIEPIIEITKIDGEKRINEITKEERKRIIKILKNFELTINGFRPIEEAIITSGGINIKEINPKTMESKIIKGLHFAGEIIDLDAFTGGFNLQIAWSTGYVSGLA